MPYRQPVQLLPPEFPIEQEMIHKRFEAAVVAPFQQVRHLVHQDVLQAGGGLPGQLQGESLFNTVRTAPLDRPFSSFQRNLLIFIFYSKLNAMSVSHNPPDYLLPCLMDIELAVRAVYREHPHLKDKEVEDIYEQFRAFYQQLAKDAEPYEPASTISARQALIDAILQALDQRQEEGSDDRLIMNPDFQPGGYPISSAESLYATAFNYLRRSARFWRKERGPTGYLKFLVEQLPD